MSYVGLSWPRDYFQYRKGKLQANNSIQAQFMNNELDHIKKTSPLKVSWKLICKDEVETMLIKMSVAAGISLVVGLIQNVLYRIVLFLNWPKVLELILQYSLVDKSSATSSVSPTF